MEGNLRSMFNLIEILASCLHYQGDENFLIARLMQSVSTFETTVNFCKSTRRYNPEDSHLQITLPVWRCIGNWMNVFCTAINLLQSTSFMHLISSEYYWAYSRGRASVGSGSRSFRESKCCRPECNHSLWVMCPVITLGMQTPLESLWKTFLSKYGQCLRVCLYQYPSNRTSHRLACVSIYRLWTGTRTMCHPLPPSFRSCWYFQWRHTDSCKGSVSSWLFIWSLSTEPTAEKITG